MSGMTPCFARCACCACSACLLLHEASAVLGAGLHTCHTLVKAYLAATLHQLLCYHKAHHLKMHRLMCTTQFCTIYVFLN